MLGDMAYSWYRCSRGVVNSDLSDFNSLMKACLQLCGHEQAISMLFGSAEKEEIAFDAGRLFTPDVAFSPGTSREAWVNSLLVQPSLFIRVRKDRARIIELLDQHNIPYKFVANNCLSLPNSSKIEAFLPGDCYVVQDASSQFTGNYFHPVKNEKWYDCCAGAGGKSLLLMDAEPTVNLTVTDIRDSILINLKDRFKDYKLKQPKSIATDVFDKAKLRKVLDAQLFDNIICDAPCSGSGTWSRTPEQLFFFDPGSLNRFTELQKTIAVNVAGYLKKGGKLFYITCSVFQRENEDVVNEIVKTTGLKIVDSKLIDGVSINADSMFITVLQSL